MRVYRLMQPSSEADPARVLGRLQRIAYLGAINGDLGIDLQVLEQEVQLARAAALQELEQAIDQQHDYQAASASIQALMFMQRFASSLQQRQQH